jgi:hypothetical protein
MKYSKLGIVIVIAGLVGSFAVKGVFDLFSSRTKAAVSVKMPSTLPAGNKAPSEEFLIEYANYKALQKQVRQMEIDNGLVEKRRLLQGTIDDLRSQVPPGFSWDEDTTSFKPQQLTPAPPAPAPQPETKKQ